jgi:hypothetical protein
MCCFFTTLLFFGPRLAFLIGWLTPWGQLKVNLAFNTWIWPLLGLIFLPWTTLMYVLVFPINTFDWIWLGFALLADIAGYVGGAQNRQKVPGYPGS